MSINYLRKVIGSRVGLSNSAETRPVIMPGDDDKGRSGEERNTKLVRILTVFAYILSVSIAAAMLSLYYVFIWDPVSHHNNSVALNASQHPVHPATYPGDKSNNATLLRPLLGNCTEDGMFSRSFRLEDMLISMFVSIFPANGNSTSLMEDGPSAAF